MTFSQMCIFIAVFVSVFVILDWGLGRIQKEWKLTQWEEEERS